MKKLTRHQELALDRTERRIRLGKWWGNKCGYKGKKGGWIYNHYGWAVIQGWHNFYLRYRAQIWAEIEGKES